MIDAVDKNGNEHPDEKNLPDPVEDGGKQQTDGDNPLITSAQDEAH